MRRLLEWWRAMRRGDHRISKVSRGRIYAKKNEPTAAKTLAKATMELTIVRADGTTEHRTVPCTTGLTKEQVQELIKEHSNDDRSH